MGSRPLKSIPLVIAAVIMVSGIFGIRTFNKFNAKRENNRDQSVVASSASTEKAAVNNAEVGKSATLADKEKGVVESSQAPLKSKNENSVIAPAPAAVPVCKVLKFRHKTARGHSDAEECSEHKNSVTFDMRGIDQKSICLRVDGVPVAFEKDNDGLVFGAVAGPKTNVAVEFCALGAVRTSPCVVSRDQFMDALGGSEKQERGPASAKWNANDNEDDPDAVGEMDRELQEEASLAQGLPVFKGWVVE